jgi:glucokinase
MMECVASVDIGGTGIKYGLVNKNGEVIYSSQCKSEANKGSRYIIDKVKLVIKEMLKYEKSIRVVGIGVSSAGQIDHVNGRVSYATDNIPGYTGTYIKNILETEFNLPAFVENDVNAAAIGEAWKGSGIGYKNIVCLTVGTGVGGCIMFDGKVEHGTMGSAGEIGHMIIEYKGLPCNCGNRGCLEQYASAAALVRNFKTKLRNGENSSVSTYVSSEDDVNALDIFNGAKAGDPLANNVLDEFIEYLGTGIINLVHVLNPQLVIIGGGISYQGIYLSNKIENYVYKQIMPYFLNGLSIKTAKLGNEAGIVGAAKIVLDNLKKNNNIK